MSVCLSVLYFNFIIIFFNAEADRTSPQSITDGQGQGQGQGQGLGQGSEASYTDTSKGSTYPVTDDTLCSQSQSLSVLSHATHNSQAPHFARDQAGYLYNNLRGGNNLSNDNRSGTLESPSPHVKPEGSISEMKGFPALNTPNTSLINYNINLQNLEGGSLEGYNHGHEGSIPHWHGNQHHTSHSHTHSNTLPSDIGGLPLTQRHHHQTSEGASVCIASYK